MPAKVGLLSVSGPREADPAEVEFPDIASLIRATDVGLGVERAQLLFTQLG
ncbi:hypothetical protein ACVIN2_006134 [Bradyrhizobium sp. USDA 3650]